MRVLLSAKAGSSGHLLPLLPLAVALRDAGHDVAIASAGRRDEVAPLGIEYVEVGIPMVDVIQRVRARYPDWRWGPDLDHTYTLIFTQINTPDAAHDLLGAIEEFRPGLVVNEYCEFGAPIAAAKHRVPCATHGLGLPMPEVLMAEAGRQIAPLWESYGVHAPRYGGMLELRYIDPCPASLDLGDSPACQRVSIALSKPKERSRATSRPLVYVSLGTARAFNRTANLWQTVLRAFRDLDVDVLATIGRSNDPSALGDLPANVTVERWHDQADVLPSCSAVVCHGGAGTMLGALAHGVPVLVLPHGADQYRNATAIQLAHAGMSCDDHTDSAAIRASVVSLLDDTTYADGARRIAASEIAAMPSPADVVTQLEELASHTTTRREIAT